ncbi:MAG TPA: SDR family NAD(P)-dependent oxidoreductase [Dehalococcoidia bacterium]|nr:SDR family NAD(P)-dependent oxidoreductase [Dehalococcoidia bacterium]
MKSVAIIGPGDDLHRALAVAAAEAGTAVALGTLTGQTEEFAVNSIANEVWVIGAEHFVRVMEGTEAAAVAAFGDEVADRFGACDWLVVSTGQAGASHFNECSQDEWEPGLRRHLTAPFLATQSIGRIMERQRSGTILLVPPAEDSVLALVARHGLEGIVAATAAAWEDRGVIIGTASGDEAVTRLKGLAG